MARLEPKLRKKQILDAAVHVASRDGYQNITRENVAKKAGIAPGLVKQYYGTMHKLKRSVMRACIKREVLPVILQGLVSKDSNALKISDGLKEKAKASLDG